jgi:hypothetical protein
MKKYLINVLISIDQLGTTLLGGFPDETISSYMFRLDCKEKIIGRIVRPIIDWLFGWQALEGGHCYHSYLNEMERRQQPPELRK